MVKFYQSKLIRNPQFDPSPTKLSGQKEILVEFAVNSNKLCQVKQRNPERVRGPILQAGCVQEFDVKTKSY